MTIYSSVCTMKYLSVLQLLPCVLFLTILFARPGTSASGSAVRADLTHVDSGRGFTNRELLRRMAARSSARAASVRSSACPGANTHTAIAPVVRGTTGEADIQSEYLIHFSIGTPRPQHVMLTLDTGSDLIWTQCACQACFDQPFPVFKLSNTSRGVLCSDSICGGGGLHLSGCVLETNVCFYVYDYGDKSITAGQIITDTFTFKAPNGKSGGTVAVPNVRFGCGQYNSGIFKSNESGIAGFGRGPLSLPSQLKVDKFSYCFTTFLESKSSPVFLGAPDNLKAQAMGPILSTPFVRNPASSHYYYLPLKGVTVGKTRLPVHESAFAIKDSGSGGTIIDSGTAVTGFPQAVFELLRSAFASQVHLPVNNISADASSMLCFDTASTADAKKVTMPKLIFHLAEGVDWELPQENYVLDVQADDINGTCIVINTAGDSDMTIIGNFQQQNMHIVYDLQSNKLVFVPARCDKL